MIDEVVKLNYQTIDCNGRLLTKTKTKNVIGKKKGFFTGKYYKKVRMTDKDYNNNH